MSSNTVTKRMLVSLVVFFAGMIVYSSSHGAAPNKYLFRTVGQIENSKPHTKKTYRIDLNRAALQFKEVIIALPTGEVIATRKSLDRSEKGRLTWMGTIGDTVGNSVVVTAKGNTFSALIEYNGETYQLSSEDSGESIMRELDLNSLPSEGDDQVLDPEASVIDLFEFSDTSVLDFQTQDLLVVYTDGACTYSGNCEQLESDIAAAVAQINLAYNESDVQINLNLVGTLKVDYSGTDLGTALTELRSTTDGIMDEVHAVRDELGADIVALIYNGSGCGIGYLNSTASSAFSVSDVSCYFGNRTLAHEIGHNQGALHDRVTSGGGQLDAYNYGYRRCNDGSVDDIGSPFFRTIMSYPCASAPRVGRFSNPNINYLEVPQGVDPAENSEQGAWNARTLNESAARIAAFRTQIVPPEPPAAPSDLIVTATTTDTIELEWIDNADSETRFIMQRSLDAADWASIASLAADTTSFSDNGLDSETTYFYRIRAENSTGVSEYSDLASGTTTAIISQPPAAPSDLSILSVTTSSITLNWIDASDNESSFTLQVSTDSLEWSLAASLGIDTTTHTVENLNSDTTYYFRIRAENLDGASDFSEVAFATTETTSSSEYLAFSESTISGHSAGNFDRTHVDDGTTQNIQERSSGGPKRDRVEFFEHLWRFNVDVEVTQLFVTTNAWVTGSEAAIFEVSVDGGESWQFLFLVDTNATDEYFISEIDLPLDGLVLVRATDEDRVQGESRDRLAVDLLKISTQP